MKTFMVVLENKKLEINQYFKTLGDSASPLTGAITSQPSAGISKKLDTSSPLSNTAKIGLRLISTYSHNKQPCFIFTSEHSCLLDYSNPKNEKDVFFNFVENCLSEHIGLLSKELSNNEILSMNLLDIDTNNKTIVSEGLIQHFRAQF